MRKDLEQKFKERWPTWFNLDGSPQQTAMAWGFAHGDGSRLPSIGGGRAIIFSHQESHLPGEDLPVERLMGTPVF